jgi:hypothetical protein
MLALRALPGRSLHMIAHVGARATHDREAAAQKEKKKSMIYFLFFFLIFFFTG